MGSDLGQRREPRFSRHVNDAFPSLEALFEAGALVEQLLAHPGYELAMRLVHAEVATVDRELDGSTIPLSQAEYAMAHGRRGGLRGFEDAAREIVRKASKELERQRARHEAAAGSVAEGV